MQLDDSLLAANIAALRSRGSNLAAARLELPVESDHVVLDAPGGPVYRPYLSALPLAVGDEACRVALASGSERSPFLFGVGLGELVDAALARGAERVLAWDRDPWLWRVALATHDWSAELASGQLVPLLGADLLEHFGAEDVCAHPLLGSIYSRERRLLHAAPARRAVLCAGGLFVDQVGAALERRGYALYTLDVERLAVEELDHAVARFEPELVVSINYREGLAEFCCDRGVPLIVWEVDPCTSFLAPVAGGVGDARIYTYRKPHVDLFRAAGFERVEYLPLAADTEVRRPIELSPEEHERYATPISFVGTSMAESVAPFVQRFAAAFGAWQPGVEPTEVQRVLTRVLEAQRSNPWLPRVGELLEELAPGLCESARASGGDDPSVLLGELAASERRLVSLATLAPLGIDAWGDAGWERLSAAGVRYRGLAGHTHELSRIYCASTINLDLGRLYQADIVTMRVFDVLACGGFVLTERNAALEELFDVEHELGVYTGGEDLRAQVAWFLERPDEARRRAERGRERVLREHTIEARVEHMLRS